MRNVLFMAMTEFRKVRDLLFKNIYIVKIYHQFSKEATITVIKHINRRIAFLPILVVAILPVLAWLSTSGCDEVVLSTQSLFLSFYISYTAFLFLRLFFH